MRNFPLHPAGPSRKALSFAAACILAGCALGAPPARQMYGRLGGASAESLIEVLEEQSESVRSVRGVAKMRITQMAGPGNDEESFSTTQAVLAREPDSFRLDTLSAFGVSYTAVSNGVQIAVLAPDEGTIYRGRALPETIANATGVAAGPAAISHVLLGQPPMPEIDEHLAWVSSSDGEDAEATRPGGKGTEIFLHAPSTSVPGETVLVGFARAPIDGGIAVPVSFEHIDPRGQVRLRARFGEHRKFGSHVLPTQIDVSAPGSQVSLTYRDLEPNPDLDASSFTLETPPGMRDLPLGR